MEDFEQRAAAGDPAAVAAVLDGLEAGTLRVAEPHGAEWRVNAWIKEAILHYFRMTPSEPMEAGCLGFFDKVPPRRAVPGVRIVPPAVVRRGAYVEPGAILMPSFVNIGAWVGAGTMVDTWATVGSCAQIGRNVHLSGGVGIGGVLEPPSARPVIIEDGAFVGSRCIVVEGVVVEKEAVLGAGVVLTASTAILDVTGPEERRLQGRIPARSVVVPGMRPRAFPAGEYLLPCALIIGRRQESTDKKTSLNQALRENNVAV